MSHPNLTRGLADADAGCRVLIVDDNPSIHDDFRKILGGVSAARASLKDAESALFGVTESAPTPPVSFCVDTVFQGKEALAQVHQALQEGQPYALAFVDGRMPPGWDGIETISQLWKVQADLQVVLCTAFSDYTWDRIRKVLGASDSMLILKKPFDNVEVLQLAHALGRKWHLGRLANERLADLDRLITERTDQLRRTMSLFEASIAQSPAGILIADAPELTLRWVSPAAMALLGGASDGQGGPQGHRSVGDWCFVQSDGSPLAIEDQPLVRAIRHGEVARNRELILRSSPSADRNVLVSAAPIRDPGGDVTAGIAVLQDVTEQRKADLEREALRAQFFQAQKLESVGRLAGGVAHDFNNMLQAILGNVEVALMGAESGISPREELLEIQSAARRSAELTRQLLAFARRQTVQPKVIDLNEVITGMLRMLRRLIGEHILLSWSPGSEVWPVKMDPCQVDQFLANLAVNARDAISGTGIVTIRTNNMTIDDASARLHPDSKPGDYVAISVTDNGSGMDEETRRHVFEPFYTTKDVGKGTGLGLATVLGIVQQNHGFIDLRTHPGEGTTFVVHIPRVLVPAGSASDLAQRTPPVGTGTLLLVEDEIQVLNLERRALMQLGYTVLSAKSPHEALAMAERTGDNIQLLVTDVVMPGMNGKELYTQLKVSFPGLRCLFVSGYTADVIADHGILEEGVWFLQKPFSIEALAERVLEALRRAS